MYSFINMLLYIRKLPVHVSCVFRFEVLLNKTLMKTIRKNKNKKKSKRNRYMVIIPISTKMNTTEVLG